MEIRYAKNSEIEELINIEKTCFPEQEAAKPEVIRERFKTFKENFIVAVVNERVVGCVNGCTTDKPQLPDELYHNTSLHKPDGDYQAVFGLEVLPEFQKRGIGGELLTQFIEMSKERGKKGVVLTCKDYLINYYEKYGFKNQGVSASSHGGAKWNDMILFL